MGSLNWILRKGARRVGCVLGSIARAGAATLGDSKPRARAITYHRFGRVPRDPWVVRPEDFAAQMAYLEARASVVSVDDVLQFLSGERSLAADSVLVTIDDGCGSTLDEGLPTLLRHRVPAVAFATAGLVGKDASVADHGERYLDWHELALLAKNGVEIGSHAFDHCALARLEPREVRRQAIRSRELLEDRLGVRVRSFAYPFGMRPDFNAETDRILLEAGYEIAFHSLHGAISPGAPAISLPRVKVEAGESLAMFRGICSGWMDGWRVVDESLARLRTARGETRAEPRST